MEVKALIDLLKRHGVSPLYGGGDLPIAIGQINPDNANAKAFLDEYEKSILNIPREEWFTAVNNP